MKNIIGLVCRNSIPVEELTEPDWNRFNLSLHHKLAAIREKETRPSYTHQIITWIRTNLTPQPIWATTLATAVTIILLIFQCTSSSSFATTGSIVQKSTGTSVSCDIALENRIAEMKDVFNKTNS